MQIIPTHLNLVYRGSAVTDQKNEKMENSSL